MNSRITCHSSRPIFPSPSFFLLRLFLLLLLQHLAFSLQPSLLAATVTGIPNVTFTLKLGSTTVCTVTKSCAASNSHLRGMVTVRSAGTSGSIAASLAVLEDIGSPDIFPIGTTVTTVNTTGSLAVDLTAAIDNFTGSEAVACEQLLITLR